MEEIFEAEKEIEQTISQLFRLEDVLEGICQEVKSKLEFDFAGISLISPERNTIEAVHGVGIAQAWSGRAKHYLEKDEDLRDIQADIVQTRRTKIVSGWYKRFDRWIYEEFQHDQLVRVYTPILLIQDKNGHIVEDWVEKYKWTDIHTRKELEGQCRTFDGLSFPNELEVISIGTLEAGYDDRNKEITDETVFELAQLISQKALDIWKSQLPWVLKTIAEKARQIMRADSATLHFLYNPINNHYTYQVFSGKVGWRFLRECPPRKNGIGRESILDSECKYVPDLSKGHSTLEMEKINKKAFDAGIKALAAFPLQVGAGYEDKKKYQTSVFSQQTFLLEEGVLYIDFQQEHHFNPEELRLGQMFANRATDAIRHATIYEQRRDREQLLTTLHSVAQSLASMPRKKDLLRSIAWDTLNILAADVVTIYEYFESRKQVVTPADRAGRFKTDWEIPNTIDEGAVPSKLARKRENVYLPSLVNHPIFKGSEFAKQERIKSVAGVQIMVDEETVGIMFINYRRPHDFTPEEIKIIETLSSSAAIAIKNRRWLTARSDIDRQLITTLDQDALLFLIVERAVHLTGANFGSIRLLDPDPSKEVLVVKAKYPEESAIDESLIHTSLNEGITGLVAREREAILVDDVNSGTWAAYYKKCFPGVASELCVPLLDEEGNLLGVIDVESRKPRAFDISHQKMLKVFADQAVIGIQNVKNQEQLISMMTLVTLGDLASQSLHKMKNRLGAIREWSQDIIDKGDRYSKEKANLILSTATQLLQEEKLLKDWMNEQPQDLDVSEIVRQALDGVKVPSRITKDTQLPDGLPKLTAGKNQLINVFNNLIQNAVDAIQDGGELFVNASRVERDEYFWVKVEIRDTGIGIPKENLDKIFQYDYTTKDDGKGTGFGLWWTKFYIQRLKGEISVMSELGEGATFSVILPCHYP